MTDHTFSIGEGGPFHHVVGRVHLLRPSGKMRGGWLVAIAWLPLMLGTGIRLLLGWRPDPLVSDLSVHTRLLVGIPLLIAAESLLTPAVRGAINQLYDGPIAEPAAVDRILARAMRMRDTIWAELVLALIAFGLGQLALWGVMGPGFFHGALETRWSLTRVWYTAIALPLVQFLCGRWLWRWAIWTYFLARLSRLPLALSATHPDRAAGLGFLAWPLTAFCGYVLALASILAGAWGTQLLAGRATIPALIPTLAIFIVAAIAVGCGPLVLFTGQVYGARRRALNQYSPLAFEYVRDFQAKWIAGPRQEPLLGSPDIQSMADMAHSFEVVASTRMFVFETGRIRDIALAAVLPMVPLIATVVPVENVVRRLGGAVLGIAL